jgi:hypothetical protein
MTRRGAVALSVLAALMLVACATQPLAPRVSSPGFFLGLWHGFSAWFALVIHLFNPEVRVYAYPNAGGWYDFGFLLGLTIGAGGGGAAAKR